MPWGGWAHEIGHQMQTADGITVGWGQHPSGYSSGYDLLDSCYPCGESVYGLSGPPVNNSPRTAFPGWLPATSVVTFNPPPTGTEGRTFVLEPLSKAPPF